MQFLITLDRKVFRHVRCVDKKSRKATWRPTVCMLFSRVTQATVINIAFFFSAIECHTSFQDPIFSAASVFPPHKFVPYVVNTMSESESTRLQYNGGTQRHKCDIYSGITFRQHLEKTRQVFRKFKERRATVRSHAQTPQC